MSFHYNPYIWVYLVWAGAMSVTLAYSIYRNVVDRLWIATQVIVIFWCLGFAFQVSGTDLKTISFWYLAANDFVGLKSPAVWLLWALKISGRRLTRLQVPLLFVLPVITDILNLTNSRHGLVYRQMWLDTSSGHPLLRFTEGPWYWMITAYSAILLVAVVAILVKAVLTRQLLHRKQGLAVASVTAVVLICIILYLVTEGSIFNYYDPTPVSISIVVVLTSLVFRFKKQETVPVPFNSAFEKMTSAVLLLDTHHRIMDLNSAAEEFLGLKASKATGRAIEEALSDWPNLAAASRDRSVNICEFSHDGRHYEAYFSELNDGLKTAGYIVVIQDVTADKVLEAQMMEQKQALAVLQERERLARELHDSLGQVLGYTNMQIQVIRGMLKSGKLSAVDDSLTRLSHVIEEANTEVREFIYEVKTTLLFKEGFFAAIRQYLSHFEQNFKISTEIRNPDNLAEEEFGLPTWIQLFRIIQEALANVRKHAQASKVVINFQKGDRETLISVADNGVGFNAGNFEGAQPSFGLEVMRERARHIGGKIRIDTEPEKGTTVTVIIPHSADRPSGLEPPESSADSLTPEGSKIKVLLADDHVLFMEGLKNLIEPRGFEVVGTARNGLEALEKARLLHPDMILMDLQMPQCNGLAATKLIKAEMPDIKIIILSMSDREQDLFAAIKNGASGYLLKGLGTEDFIEQLCDLASNSAVISSEMASQFLEEFNPDDDESIPGSTYPISPEEQLTQRQIEILSLVARGYTYKEIASKLFISERTVKYQMADILRLLHLQTRRQAIAYAQRVGLVKETSESKVL